MGIVEIYKDVPNTMWKNDETFLCVFDDNNNLINDYDFCTGLKIMQDSTKMTIYINDDDLVAGKWVLYATKIDENGIKKKCYSSGVKGEYTRYKKFNIENPWNNCSPGYYVSRRVREDRLKTCKECPFLNKTTLECSIDKRLVLESTKHEKGFCPEGKWGETVRQIAFDTELAEQEQKEFEKELEEYLDGL